MWIICPMWSAWMLGQLQVCMVLLLFFFYLDEILTAFVREPQAVRQWYWPFCK